MNPSSSSQVPSFDIILDYIFQELSEEEELLFENFLDKNSDYASIIDGLISLSLTKKLNRGELESLVKQSQEWFLINVNRIIP